MHQQDHYECDIADDGVEGTVVERWIDWEHAYIDRKWITCDAEPVQDLTGLHELPHHGSFVLSSEESDQGLEDEIDLILIAWDTA